MGQPATDPGAHPPEVSGVGAQATDQGACPPRHFMSVCPGSWVSYQGVCPPRISVVGTQATNLGARNQGLGECWGCSSGVHSPGVEWVGVQEVRLLQRVL